MSFNLFPQQEVVRTMVNELPSMVGEWEEKNKKPIRFFLPQAEKPAPKAFSHSPRKKFPQEKKNGLPEDVSPDMLVPFDEKDLKEFWEAVKMSVLVLVENTASMFD